LGSGSPLDFAGLIKGSQFKNSENVAEIVINLTKKHDRSEPSYMMVQRLRPIIQKECSSLIPQTNIKFVEPPAGPPTMAAIVAEVYGNNPIGIRHLSERVKDVFTKTDGLVDIDIMQDEIVDTIEVRVNGDKIARSGLNIKHVNEILYLAYEGMEVAAKNSDKASEQIPIFVTLSPDGKKFSSKNVDEITMKLSSLKLMNAMGMMVPLTEVVEIHSIKSNPMIMTKNLHQMTNVVAETDMVSQVYPLMDARNAILDNFTDEYEIHKIGLFNLELIDKKSQERYELLWDGEMEVTLDTFVDLGGAFIAALVLIFLLMVIYYKSFILSGIILLGSFLSIIGVIFGHFIMDIFTTDTFFLTATSLIGFIALIGISSRNSLLLIDFTKSLMLDKGMHSREAIAYASATRAKPIFLTAAAIILASTLLASDAVFGGLGVSLIFGTIAAVIASLIVVPILLDNCDLEKEFQFQVKKSVSIIEP
jgi:multidrug efflux pump subunit AcrB